MLIAAGTSNKMQHFGLLGPTDEQENQLLTVLLIFYKPCRPSNTSTPNGRVIVDGE